MNGYLHSIETLGAADGPGIRTVLFMQGCPYRCIYCHNPDTWDAAGYVMKFTPAQLAKRIMRFKEYYGKTGGVTAGGGEPLLQSAFLTELFALLKKEGIHTTLDTAAAVQVTGHETQGTGQGAQGQGTGHRAQGAGKDIGELLELTDLVILDIKHTDPAKFEEITGNSYGWGQSEKRGRADGTACRLQNTLDFLSLCAGLKKRIWLRQVIVPGYTDLEEQVLKLKEIAAKYGAEKIELLPYHTAGAAKWDALGFPYPLKGVQPPSPDTMKRLNAVLTLGPGPSPYD